jgi:hypothetical protein
MGKTMISKVPRISVPGQQENCGEHPHSENPEEKPKRSNPGLSLHLIPNPRIHTARAWGPSWVILAQEKGPFASP